MHVVASSVDSVVVGVDTHKSNHVAAVLSNIGAVLGTASFPATQRGCAELVAWSLKLGPVACIGIEGTGSYGAGLSRYCATRDIPVREVSRPGRQLRRLRGKSDPIDAVAAARAVLSGEASGLPKRGDGDVESIRALRVARQCAVKARVQATNSMHNLVIAAPDVLRRQLSPLSADAQVATALRFRCGGPTDPVAATRMALRSCARQHDALSDEIRSLDAALEQLVIRVAPPALMSMRGVGIHVAAALLVAVGDNADRVKTEAGFAALCGVSPLECSSGKTSRRRLNRGGNREANAALWRIAFTRRRYDDRTRAYVERRRKEGKSDREITRCLKRYIARRVYRELVAGHRGSEQSVGLAA